MKRFFDFSVSVILVLVLSPVFVLLAILVGCKLGRPIVFRQMRPGLKGNPFMIYKFRSLTEEKDEKGNLLPDSQRFNRFSSFIRKSSFDELPELINVLKGDMSLVGPRPLLMKYLQRYNHNQARRHDVRPGITGWAQVNGRNLVSWEEKFRMDIWYVDHHNLWLDLKILLKTLIQVYKQHGIHQMGHVTAKEFLGSAGHE